MANIRLKRLFEAEDFQAKSKQTGKLVHFKSKDSYQAALKAGTHEDPKAKKGDAPKAAEKPNDMFGGDYSKDRGGETPKADTTKAAAPKADVKSIVKDLLKKGDKEFRGAYKLKDVVDDFKDNIDDTDEDGKELKARLDKGEDGTYVQTDETEGTVVFNDGSQYEFAHVEDGPIPVTKVGKEEPNTSSKLTSMLPKKTNYDDKSYWKDADYEKQGQGADDDWDDDDSWGEGPQLTSDRLNKIETALEDELDLRGNGFETTRESGGGMGGWEGPMQIMDKNADFDDEDNYITLSVGSSNNDGKMSIVFANYNGEPYFEPDYDALTGDKDLEPQQAYKVTKALMKMPEVQKLLKGEMSKEEFQPIYDKLKSKFSKTK
jgi:hypothetical protein